MPIELRHLRYFAAVAEELHFGRAAERLHIAQPGLSQQIQALERELGGVVLLDRTRRRVKLTAAGQVLLDEGRRALAQVERAVNLARRTGEGVVGRLTLAATESATYTILPGLLREYRRRYPNVDLVVREMLSHDQVAALRRGEIDVAFVRTPVDVDGFEVIALHEESMAVVLPREHRLAKRRTVPLASLAKESFIVHPTRPSGWADFILTACRSAGFEPDVVQDATSTTVAVSFVAAELGVTLVPEGLASGISRPGVVTRPIAPSPRSRLLAAYRADAAPPTARSLLDIVRRGAR